MKILHIIYDDPANPWVGGGGAIRTWKINRFIAKKHSIVIVSGAFPGCERDQITDEFHVFRIGSDKNYSLSRLSFSLQVGRFIRTIEHDILVEDFSGNSLTFAPFFSSKPSVAVLQNFFGFNIVRKRFLIGVISYLYERFFIRYFNWYIPVNASLIEKFIPRLSPNQYRIIPPGIDSEYLKKVNTSSEFILFVGRLDFMQKGIDILLKSLSKIAFLGIKLVIVGDGDMNRLFKMAADNGVTSLIEYHRRISQDKLIFMYRKSFFLCLPSRYEGWPLVCLESYSQGKPVIGTDIPGLENVLIDGVNGLKVAQNDPDAFSNAMKQLIINEELRATLGAGGYHFAANFTWEKQAALQEDFYRLIISESL
jgi:glycosyltransferase involved in cell wall biosynthesis